MAAPELGAKQLCPNCQAKFYDLSKRPAHCPKCEHEFDPDEALKSRRVVRGRAVPNYEEAEDKVADKDTDDEADEEEAEDVTPEIDQAVEADPIETDEESDPGEPAPAKGPDDLGVDFEEEAEAEDDEAVPFLEEEEDDDDLAEDDLEGLPEADDDDR